MGNTIEQNIKIKEIFDVSEALKGIKQIQDALGKLALDPGTKASFNNLFQNMENQAKKASAAAASGFKNKGDVTAYTRAMDQIVDSYDRIISKIELLKADGNITLDIDTSEFKQVNARINELKRNLSDLGDKMTKSLSTIDKIESRRGANGTIKSVGSWQTAIKEFKDGNIQKATAALRVLKGLMTKASNNGVDFEKDKTWKAYKKDYEELKKAIEDYNTANQQYKQDSSELAVKDKRRQEILEDTNKLLEQTEELTKKSGQGAREYATETEKAASDTQKLNSELEHFKSKAAYFFGISNAINLFKRAVRSAFETVKDLDAIMTETAVVTKFDVGDMWTQLPEYTQRANELGVTIHDTYEAATLFYQQGLKTNEVMAISNETLKMARIAGLDAATASDRMTNALRGFNMELDKVSAQRVNDVYSKLAAITASNTDEISTAMTKVASLAHNANMEFETTAAFLAQIIESTRESAETAGTALKTVVARFSEVKKLYSKGELLGEDEEGEQIDVNKVSTALRSAGINLNEYLTGAKGLDDIFMELAEKWDSLDQVQQRYIATMAAGSRQQSRFIALMSDYKRTVQLVEAANNANGASEEQYGKTLESLQTKLARLKNAWNEFILGLANSDAIKGAVDLLTGLITAINNLIKLISGKNAGVKMITSFFTVFTAFKIGQKAIGKNDGITKFFTALTGNAKISASASAGEIVSSFYSNLANKIANFKMSNLSAWKDKKLEGIFSPIQKLANYWSPDDQFKKNVMNRINPQTNVDQREAIEAALDNEKLSLKELDEVLAKNGQSFKTTGKEGRQFGLTMGQTVGSVDKFNTTMRVAANVTLVAGSALMIWGSNLEKEGNEAGKIIKILGMAFTAFGTIMSVYLPLQAQIGAKGVTAAIASIPIVGWVAAAIAALTALIAVFVTLGKENSAENQLKKATEASKAAAEAADEAREAYEKLSEAWDSLDEKYDAIENATKGTQEWRDAIREVNNAVLELLGTYEGLRVTRDSDGILKITNQEEFDSMMQNRTLVAEGAASAAKMRQHEASQNVRYKNLGNGWSGYVAYKDIIDKYEGHLEDLASMTDEELAKAIKESYDEQGAYWTNAEIAVNTVRDYIDDYNNYQNDMATERAVFGATILEKAQIDKEMQKYANTFVNDNYIDNLLKKSRKNYEGEDTDKIKDAYASARGYDNFKALEDADSTVKDLSKEQMIDYLATSDALEKANEQLQIFTNTVGQLDEKEKALLAESEGGALTLSQAQRLKAYEDDEKMSLFNQLGGEDVYGSYEAFENWFNNAVDIALNNFNTGKFSSKFASLLDEELTGGLTSETFKGFTDNLKSVWNYSGEEGVNAIQESIKNIKNSANMSSDELESFIKAINSVDWTSADSIATLDELANEYGISEEAIEALENQIIDLNKAINQVDIEKLTSVLGLAKKIGSGEQGRSFTKEQYEELISSGAAKKKDFVFNIETENYDYIGEDILDVKNAIIQKADDIIAQLDGRYANTKYVEQALAGGSAESGNPEELRSFIGRYITAAGEDAIVDWDFFYSASLEDLQQTYDRLMQEYGQRYDIQNQMNDATLAKYQTDTGAENAARALEGDEEAKTILKQQLANSGISEEEKQKLLGGVEQGDILATKSAGAITDIFAEANQYGIATEDLNEYIASLQQVDTLENANIGTLYELALANAKYQDGFKNVIDSYDEWIELKKEDGSIRPDEGNEVQTKAYTQLKKDLKEMFNLTEDVSDEFLQSAENVELLEKAVNGDMDAVSELRGELAKTNIADSVVNKDEISKAIDAVIADMPNFEFGMSMDDSEAMKALDALLQASGMTAEEIQAIYDSLGWAPELKYEEMDVASASKLSTTGWQEIIDPVTQQPKKVRTDSLVNYATDGKVKVPVIGNSQRFVKPSMPTSSPSAKNSGSGGGGGSSKKPSYWENPYDELYNLQEKINEALRTREALERRYQKLLKQEQATLADIRKSYYAQINNLRTEADLQKQFAAGRLRQINEVGSKIYTDSEGNRSTFNSLGVTKYASYNAQTGLIQIDWNGLEAISRDSSREEEGKAAEAYISKLEELVSSYEEVRDKLWDIEDEIESLREAAIESYLSFEDRVMEALVNSYQQQIDSYQAMSDAIEKANSEVIDSLREQIDLSRQIRDNTEKEKNISDMENRLAYLQRDTSGANALEIQKLQKDLEDARESYTDDLVNQAIDKMQNDADLAAEQRARQIETMQEQLEIMKNTGVLWDNVYSLMTEAAAGDGALSPHSNLVELLKSTEAFESLSNIGQAKWWSEVAEEFHKAWIGLSEAEDKYKKDANNDGTIYDSGTQNAIEEVQQAPATTPTPEPVKSSTPTYDDKTKMGVALAVCEGYWGNGTERTRKLNEKGFNSGEIQNIVNKIVNAGYSYSKFEKQYGLSDSDIPKYKYSAFKTGGLADFTGPAWLDGTKTRPELILNAQDSANFIALKDILASLLNVQGGRGIGGNGGDNYFDIDISANLGSDYDVDKLTEKIKRDIYQDGQYRNVNTINYLR